jgi:hypothetical protein
MNADQDQALKMDGDLCGSGYRSTSTNKNISKEKLNVTVNFYENTCKVTLNVFLQLTLLFILFRPNYLSFGYVFPFCLDLLDPVLNSECRSGSRRSSIEDPDPKYCYKVQGKSLEIHYVSGTGSHCFVTVLISVVVDQALRNIEANLGPTNYTTTSENLK